ncbi:MAG: WhiB family transcriptional regulator [Ilumatobacter sp.]|nr:WhiB family transcriptional regulator [Ilumatobacter sp.]
MSDLARLLARLEPAWHRDALCREYDLALFYPTRGQSIAPAVAVCERCSVLDECLAEALDDPSLDHGVRGGLSVRARRQLRKEARHDAA